MRQSAAGVGFPIAARLDSESEKRAQQIARDETRPAGNYFAVVNQPPLGQRILDSPRHPDRVIVLDVLWQYGFARTGDRLTQARHAHPGGEAGAESDLFDKFERALFADHAARTHSPEVMITMALERVEQWGFARRGRRTHFGIWSIHSLKIRR